MMLFSTKKNFSVHAVAFSLLLFAGFYTTNTITDPLITAKHVAGMFLVNVSIISVLLYYFKKQYKLSFNLNGVDVAILAFILYLLIYFTVTGNWFINSVYVLNVLACAIVYFLYQPFFRNSDNNIAEQFKQTLVGIVSIVAIIQVAYGYLQYFDILPRLQQDFKIGGAYGNPGPYSNFIVCLLPIVLFGVINTKKRLLKILTTLSSVLIISILPFTQSRTAWIAAFVTLCFFVFKLPKVQNFVTCFMRNKRNRILIFLLGIALFIGLGYGLLSFKKDSASGRLFIWKVSLEMIKDKPLFGHGIDSYGPIHNTYQADYFKNNPNDSKNAYLADSVNFAFNEYIQITSEVGLIGLFLFIAVFITAFLHYFKNYSDRSNNYIEGGFLTLIVFLVLSSFSYPFKSISTIFTLFIGLSFLTSAGSSSYNYNFITTSSQRKLWSIAGVVLSILWLRLAYVRYEGEKAWKEAFLMVRNKNFDEAKQNYDRIKETMFYNPYFFFNYGAELTVMGDYEKSIEILDRVKDRLCDADYYIYLGTSYEGLGMVDKAIESYYKAAYMMPIKYLPKYKIVILYDTHGRKDEALKLAKEIMEMPIKVESVIVTEIRKDLANYIKFSEEKN